MKLDTANAFKKSDKCTDRLNFNKPKADQEITNSNLAVLWFLFFNQQFAMDVQRTEPAKNITPEFT